MANTVSVSIAPNPTELANAFFRMDVSSFLKKQINQLAMSVERYAKQLTPVDTGRLRASINTQPQLGGISAVVSTNTDYAIYVHDGTRYMRARPFMTMGAAYAQVAELKDVNIRLDKQITDEFKAVSPSTIYL